jgi:tetratricopeptide (TPR) repeat protein
MTLRRSVFVLALAAALASGVLWMRGRRGDHNVPAPDAAAPPAYVGGTACRECHAAEYKAWETSHHRLAMQPAEPGTVLGDFDDARFTYGSVTTIFFRRDGRLWVRTDGADGTLRDVEVKYTFGVTPLQQYLIENPAGHVQALGVSWDSRPKSEGGQRWFHLYPGDGVDHTDELHWTGRQQNWNFMCADCHSTNLRKGYDATADRFQSTWSDLNVGCEACHGPGSRHVAWGRLAADARRASSDKGLTVSLTERKGVIWAIEPGALVPKRTAPRTTSIEIGVCAQCHSRREQLGEGYYAGARFEDYYAASAITPGLYYADGQQRDEVYTHASFLQSKMAHTGVTCSDCHDPHSARTRASDNHLCTACHATTKYDSPTHHFHRAGGAPAQCVACHMPETTYMVVDPRRDHSIRVPRPDRTISMGAPNACNGCHKDRSPKWADEQIRKRTGKAPGGFQAFAEAFHASESNDPAAAADLRRIADDRGQPAVVRASALARLGGMPGRVALDAASAHVADPDPTVRRAAVMVFDALPLDVRRASVAPLLRDPVRSVRVQAAWVLAPVAAALAGSDDEPAFARAADEFIASRRYRADRPEDRTTLGTFFAQMGRRDEAMEEYRAARRLSPRYTPAYVNLSDLQRQEGREPEAERTLRQGLAAMPKDPTLHHALGLSLARSGRQAEAIDALKRATELSDDARFAYPYAVALHSAGRVQAAIDMLEQARGRDPRDRDVLFALATFHRDAGRMSRALEYAEQLQRYYPEDPEAHALVASLRPSR